MGEIVPENVKAMQAIYAASMLEETHVFNVADRLVELWAGRPPARRAGGGRWALAAYERGRLGRAELLTKAGRLAAYRRCFGVPGRRSGRRAEHVVRRALAPVPAIGRAYRRQQTARELLPARRAASREAVRKGGRDLAANLSLYGFGAAGFAARLQKQVDGAVRVLQTEAVRQVYGARDAWQLVDGVALLELGGAATPSGIDARPGGRDDHPLAREHVGKLGAARPA